MRRHFFTIAEIRATVLNRCVNNKKIAKKLIA